MANRKVRVEEQATATRTTGPDLFQSVNAQPEVVERTAQLEAVVQKIGKAISTEAYPPAEMAQKTEATGVSKGTRDALSTVILGILAGVFIGLGAMFFTLVTTASGLSFGMNRLVGGFAFCLGLILVVVAGAELFTGNTLIVMSWLSGRTSFARLLRNWGLVYFANLAGALSLAWLMYYTTQWALSGNGVGANAVLIANAKVNLSFGTALARGILCNALVCLAVWLCTGARTVTDKILAILFPITAFVAGGFEHSIANMYFIPMGILLSDQPAVLSAAGLIPDAVANLNWMGFVNNLIPVTIGNIIGGGILIGVVYWVAYLGRERTTELVAARPWMRVLVPDFVRARPAATPGQLPEPVRAQIAELIRIRVEKPAIALDRAGKALLAVLARAKDDGTFLAKMAENPARALEGYDLTDQEKAALASGDIRWVESKIGTLEDPLRTWLTARLTQEKW